jgi:hypothetical protein
VSPTDAGRSRSWIPAACAFLATFFFALALSFQSVDLTDTGFHLTNQVQAFADAKHPLTAIFLTDYIGGAWLSLSPRGPWLWWSRLGHSLLLGMSAAVCALILRRFSASDRHAWLAAVAGFVAVPVMMPQVVDYYSFPAFLLFLWLYLFVAFDGAKPGAAVGWAFALGILNAVIAFSRMPHLIMAGLFPCLLGVASLQSGRRVGLIPVEMRSAARAWLLGGAVGGAVLIAFYAAIGVEWTAFLPEAQAVPTIVTAFARSVARDLAIGCGFALCFGLLYGLRLRITLLRTATIVGAAGAALGFVWLARVGMPDSEGALRFGTMWTHLLIALIVSFVLSSLRGGVADKEQRFVWATFAPVLLFSLGSTTGDTKILYLLPLVLGYLALWVLREARPWQQFPWAWLAVGLLPLVGVFFSAHTTYRDGLRYRLDESFRSPALAWTRSSAERVEVLDGVLGYLARHLSPREPLLAVNGISTLYYLTNTRPWLLTPWPFALSAEVYQKTLLERADREPLPKYAVMARGSTSNRDWPLGVDASGVGVLVPADWKPNLLATAGFLRERGYQQVYSNEMFVIFHRTSKSGLP